MPIVRPALATVLAVGALAASDVLDDMERDAAGLVGRGDAGVFATVSIVPAPAGLGHGRALRLSWPDKHGAWIDAGYEKGRPVPVAERGTFSIAMPVWTEAFAGIGYIAVRCNDAQGETFEWRGQLPDPGQSGWRTLTVVIDPDKPSGHWGGAKPDGHVDFPLQLKGYAVRLEAKAPAGAVVIDDVALVPPAASSH